MSFPFCTERLVYMLVLRVKAYKLHTYIQYNTRADLSGTLVVRCLQQRSINLCFLRGRDPIDGSEVRI